MNKFTINIASRNENLGISVRKYSPEKALVIEDVVDLSPAFQCDLKVGDIILKVNGKSTKYFASKIASQLTHSKKTLSILIKRKSEPMTLKTLRDSYSESSGSNFSRATTASNFYACTNPNSTQLFSNDSAPEEENRNSDILDDQDLAINFKFDTKRKSQNQSIQNISKEIKKLKSTNNCFAFKKSKFSKSLSKSNMPESDQFVTANIDSIDGNSIKQKTIIKTKVPKKSQFPVLSMNQADDSTPVKEINPPRISQNSKAPGTVTNLNNSSVTSKDAVKLSLQRNSKSPVTSVNQEDNPIQEKEIIQLRRPRNPNVREVAINLDDNQFKKKEIVKRPLQRNLKSSVSSVNEEDYSKLKKKMTKIQMLQNTQNPSPESSNAVEYPESVVVFKMKKSYNSMEQTKINKNPRDSKIILKAASSIDGGLNSRHKIITPKPVAVNTTLNDKPKITFRRKYNQN